MKALLFLGALALPTGQAAAKCAPSSLRPQIATPAGTVIPEGGGIVVVADAFFDDGKVATGDVAVQRGWRFADGSVPQIAVIAPGLAVYRGRGAKLALEGQAFATTTDRVAVLDAPKVKQIVAMKTFSKKPRTEVEVVLDGKVPAGAVAIVAVDAKGKPMSFGRIEAGGELRVFARGRCDTLAEGTAEPKAGETIAVFWVDAMGRSSPASKPVAVVGKKLVIE